MQVHIPEYIAENPEQVQKCRGILSRWMIRRTLRHFSSDASTFGGKGCQGDGKCR